MLKKDSPRNDSPKNNSPLINRKGAHAQKAGSDCDLCQKEVSVGRCQECNKSVCMTCADMHPKIPVCATHVIHLYTEVLGDKRKRMEEYSRLCHEQLDAARGVVGNVERTRKQLTEKEQTLRANLDAAELDALHKVKIHFAQQKEKLHIIVHSAKSTVERKGDEAEALRKVTAKRLAHIDEILADDRLLFNCDVEHHAVRRPARPEVGDELVNIFLKQNESGGSSGAKHVIPLPVLHAFESARAPGEEANQECGQPLITNLTRQTLKKLAETEVGQNARKIVFHHNK